MASSSRAGASRSRDRSRTPPGYRARHRDPRPARERVAPLRSFERFMANPHENPMWVEEAFLRDVGSYEDVVGILGRSGWIGLMTLRSHADIADTCEFLSTFHYIGYREDEGISYLHRGVECRTTMAQLRQVFGWDERGDWYSTYGLGAQPQVWRELTQGGSQYQASDAKARDIADPALFYLQFIISRTLFARKSGGDKPNRLDIAVLGAFQRGIVPDFARFLCSHWQNISPTGPVCCGGMITYLLRQRHRQPDHQDGILQPAFADRTRFLSGRHVRVRSTGALVWVYHRDPARLPQLSPPRQRRRQPPPQPQHQPAPAPVPPPPQPAAHQGAHEEQASIDAQRYATFNMLRVYHQLAPPDQPPVMPPLEWQIGDPIPPEFLPTPPPDGD